MSEEELLELCSDKGVKKFKGPAPYWVSEIYGFGKHIREYAYFPKRLPLIIFTEHSGPVLVDKFNYYEINHDAPTVMLHSPVRVKKWRDQFKKPCYNLYSPFVFYRRKNNITISNDACGTLAYPVHSSPEVDIISNMEDYILQLKNLPKKYHPISVSLHYHDINKGLHKIFFKHGITVYTAGSPFDYRFTERYYSILRKFKYSTSNFIGSYLFYSVEMNIPFFLYGDPPVFKGNTNSHLAKEVLDVANTKDEVTEFLTKMFSAQTDVVTLQQKQLVESTLGLHNGIGRLKMAQILYFNYLKFFFKQNRLRLQKKLDGMKRKIFNTIKL